MRTLAEDLHCTSVNLLGSDVDRLESCARSAAEAGLEVWLQPRLIDRPHHEVLDHLVTVGEIARRLAMDGADTYVHPGCELTIFLPDLIRGAAGEWERVDWSGFDLVGVNLYREDANRRTYAGKLASLVARGKPVIVTEFGCCTYPGAERAGGGGHEVIDYSVLPPRIDPSMSRDEAAQADHLEELVKLYAGVGVAGCFVYAFSEPTNPFSEDPAHDLDKASYGIVRTLPGDPAGGTWQKKQAFDRLAGVYEELSSDRG